ncbi:MAG: hypothetical protein INQ03_11115 [Candidatus Heimdallarchaeota archaeon]|nr:hypothetical protein [Candidatus Heimdallarchaeota archaeon]
MNSPEVVPEEFKTSSGRPSTQIIEDGQAELSTANEQSATNPELPILTLRSNVPHNSYIIYDLEMNIITNGEMSLEKDLFLASGQYIVDMIADDVIRSDPISVFGEGEVYTSEFSKVTLSPYSFEEVENRLVALRSSDKLIWEGTLLSDVDVYLPNNNYELYANGEFQKSISSEIDIIYPVLLYNRPANSIGLDAVVEFGDLIVNVTTSHDSPLSSISIKLYNSSTGEQMVSSSTNAQGISVLTLAPGDYDLVTYSINDDYTRISNDSVTITGGADTVMDIGFTQVIAYYPTNTETDLYQYSGSRYISYRYTAADTHLARYFLPAGNRYYLTMGGSTYHFNTTMRGKIIIGSKINNQPVIDTISHSGRVNTDEHVNITITSSDIDFDPLSYTFTVNTGSYTVLRTYWSAYDKWSVDLRYFASSVDEIYQLNISVSDGDLSDYDRIYLSDRTSTITLNSTAAGDRPLNTEVSVYEYDGDYVTYKYTSSTTGTATLSILDGEYYLRWIEDYYHISANYKFDATTGSYYFAYSWAEIRINVTKEFDLPATATVYIYNDTTSISSRGTDSNGISSFVVPTYTNYSYRARMTNYLYDYYNSAPAGIISNDSFSFGAIAVYAFDGSTALNKETDLYYNTTNTIEYISYQYTGTDGIAIYNLAPGNYAVKSFKTPVEFYYNIAVVAGNAEIVGDFVNSNPVITSISASPARINANENTTISLVFTDNDIVDTHTFSWTSNVGSFIGTGQSVIYVAPATQELYKIEVTIHDNYGGTDQSYIYVSNRVASITVNSTTTNGDPLNTEFNLYRYDNYVNVYQTYKYSSSTTGLATFTGIYDGEYLMTGRENNDFEMTFLLDGENILLNYTWGVLEVNVNTHDAPLATTTRVLVQGTETSISSQTSTNGLAYYILKPGTYDVKATSSATNIYSYDVVILGNELSSVTLEFGQINSNYFDAFGNPMNKETDLYTSTGMYLTYKYLGTDGHVIYDVAPGNYTLKLISYPNTWIYNLIVTPLGMVYANLTTGALAIYSDPAVSTRIYYQDTTTTILSGNTDAEGLKLYHLAPGTYDVLINGILFPDITIIADQRVIINEKNNRAPSIVSVSSSNGKLVENQDTEIRVVVTDIDYDYDNLQLTATTNAGSIDTVHFAGFETENVFAMKFNYHSPSSLQSMVINITITDESGGFDSYIFILSNQFNLIHAHSSRGDGVPETTTLRIYDVQSGTNVKTVTVYGYESFNLEDGYYNFVFDEVTDIYLYKLWILGGETYNVTARFGELTVTSLGSGGEKLNSEVDIYNGTTDAYISYQYTGSDGEAFFVLAPGYYKVIVRENTDITFYVTITGGGIAYAGAGIPDLITPADDLQYQYGDTGNELAWEFTDTNPHWFNITLDGENYANGAWDGSIITINVDGLEVGDHYFRIYVNDTYGLTNTHLVTVSVTPPPAPHAVPGTYDTVEFGDTLEVSWSVSALYPDKYIIYLDGVAMVSGSWSNGSLTYDVGSQLPGTYNVTLFLNDTLGTEFISSIFVVYLEDPLPTLNDKITDLVYEIGESNQSIYWIFEDNNPATFSLYQNGTSLITGAWTSLTEIRYSLPELAIGVYNYTLVVEDLSGGQNIQAIWVTVEKDQTAPYIQYLSGYTYPEDELIFMDWNATDYHPNNYSVSVNGEILFIENWVNFISFNHTFEDPGEYTIKLEVWDTYGNLVVDEFNITITIVDLVAPVINGFELMGFNESTAFDVDWQIVEENPSYCMIYLDSVKVAEYNLTSIVIRYSSTGLSAGLYNLTLVVFDVGGNSDTFTTMLQINIVDTDPPQISGDATLSTTETSITLSWSITDAHPAYYELYHQGSLVLTKNMTLAGDITYTASNLNPGSHNFTLIVYDVKDNFASFTTIVTVEEDSNDLAFLTTPYNLVIGKDVEYILIWQVIGSNPNGYTVFLDGTDVQSDSWTSGGNIEYIINFSVIGSYNVKLVATNLAGDSIEHNISIVVIAEVAGSNTTDTPYPFLFFLLTLGGLVSILRRFKK